METAMRLHAFLREGVSSLDEQLERPNDFLSFSFPCIPCVPWFNPSGTLRVSVSPWYISLNAHRPTSINSGIGSMSAASRTRQSAKISSMIRVTRSISACEIGKEDCCWIER